MSSPDKPPSTPAEMIALMESLAARSRESKERMRAIVDQLRAGGDFWSERGYKSLEDFMDNFLNIPRSMYE